MKVLIADDTLGSPKLVQPLLQELERAVEIVVAGTLQEALEIGSLALIILGGRFLNVAREFRQAHPDVHIIGRLPWSSTRPEAFYPWGNELREPTLHIASLIRDWMESAERGRETP